MATKYSTLLLTVLATFIAPGMASRACPAKSSSTTRSATVTPTGLPASCTYRPQATYYDISGCDDDDEGFACPSQPLCIADALVTLPCGCDRAAVQPTTTTLCPTASGNCFQCSTGWGIGTVTDPACPPSPTAAP